MLPPFLQNILHYKAAIIAGLITLFGISNFQSIHRKQGWPQHEVLVIKSSAVPDPSDARKGTLDFAYRYEIGARKVSSARVFASTFRQDPKFMSGVSEVVTRFPAGSRPMAVVNPDDPYESYLDPTPGMIDYVLPGLGAAGLLIFLTQSILTRKRSNQSSSD